MEKGNERFSKQETKKQKQKDKQKDETQETPVGQVIGPELKRIKKMNYQQLLLENLPFAEKYQRSYMHKQLIQTVITSSRLDLIITISIDGHLKFWKKVYHLIQFIKHFKAHSGVITGTSLSKNHNLLCTVSVDKTLKVFDVLNYDLMFVVKLGFIPSSCEFIPVENSDRMNVAVSQEKSGRVFIINPIGEQKQGDTEMEDQINVELQKENENKAKEKEGKDKHVVDIITTHMHPVKFIKMNHKYQVCVSIDQRANIELWDYKTLDFPEPSPLAFEFKIDTDYPELSSLNLVLLSFNLSPFGKYLIVYLKDKTLRLYNFYTGKLVLVIDESIKRLEEILENYQEGSNALCILSKGEFEKRVILEKEMEASKEYFVNHSMEFDENEEILIYSSLVGIKYYNIEKKELVKVIGKGEHQRFLKLAVYQGKQMRNPSGTATSQGQRRKTDPTIYATAFKKHRFYIFSKRQPEQNAEGIMNRDIINQIATKQQHTHEKQSKIKPLVGEVILQTTSGDIHLQLFSQDCPKTCQNFIGLCKNNFYDGLIFHRVIKGFMIQTGCEKGDGTGGKSLWGGTFADEIRLPKIKHQRPYMISMANAGPNTNNSQFFITVVPTPWLDGKHTVFGRVIKGMEVVMKISCESTSREDKPLRNIKIIKAKVAQMLGG